MSLPEVTALRNFIEVQQASLADPAERDRSLAAIERELRLMMAAIATYRGDAQVQMRGADANTSEKD